MSGAAGATARRNARCGSPSPARRTTGGAAASAVRATGPLIVASTPSAYRVRWKRREHAKIVTTGAQSAMVVLRAIRRPTQQPIACGRAIGPAPFIACCVRQTWGLRHRDRIAACNRRWIGCLRRARVATRQGQRVDVSTFSCRLLEIASGHRRSIGRGSAPEPASDEEG